MASWCGEGIYREQHSKNEQALTMDAEKPLRDEIRDIMQNDFLVFEEVCINSLLHEKKLRADLIIIPKDDRFTEQTFAIEVKNPRPDWQPKHWSYVAKQAFDYIGGKLEESIDILKNRKIDASFIFPSPDYHCPGGNYDQHIIQGILQLAAQFRIGRATRAVDSVCGSFTLSIGANDIWTPKSGWTSQAVYLLKNKIRHGSGKISR